METNTRPHKRGRTITPPPGTAAAIPNDVLFSHVFLKLPVKSLLRFKAVCRSWRAAVDDPAFVRRHLELSRTAIRPPLPSLLVIPSKDDVYNDPNALFEDVNIHRLRLDTAETDLMVDKAFRNEIACRFLPTHCDGLVAIANETGPVFVCNPATREVVELPLGSPDAKEESYHGPDPQAAIGFDPWHNRYYVSRYFYRKYDELFDEDAGMATLDYDIGHEIFTLGGGRWEATRDPPRPIHSNGRTPACTGSGAIYWFLAELEPYALLKFSLRDETFDLVNPPPGCTAGVFDRDYMIGIAGQLYYVHRDDQICPKNLDVWVAADDIESLRYHVDLRNDPADHLGMHGFMPVVSFGGGDETTTLLFVLSRELFIYDVRTESFVKVIDAQTELRYERPDGSRYTCDPTDTMHYVLPYVESIISIRARNY
uniref:F-box domain-containing protein n=1 Tax=Leersia perrieri TaxID=77586 RepID=A0A0D9W452_9ORYZ